MNIAHSIVVQIMDGDDDVYNEDTTRKYLCFSY